MFLGDDNDCAFCIVLHLEMGNEAPEDYGNCEHSLLLFIGPFRRLGMRSMHEDDAIARPLRGSSPIVHSALLPPNTFFLLVVDETRPRKFRSENRLRPTTFLSRCSPWRRETRRRGYVWKSSG